MCLENLATELLEFIVGYLFADGHLNALCQTNRRFYCMLNQRLYDQDAHSSCRALSWGAWKGLIPCVRRSLDSGADVNIVNDYVVKNYADETPIFMAVRNQDFDTVHLLLSRGADVNRRNKTGDNLVYFAVSTGNIDMVRLILAQGVDPTCHDGGDVPPLLLAVRRGYLEIAETLLDQGVEIDDGDSWGETPLQVAMTGGQHEILKLFLDRNFIRNDPTGDIGADALEVAIVRPDFRALKLLLEGGANPLARRWTGYNAIISATLSREEDMAIFMTEPLNDLSEIKDRVGKGLLWGVDPNTDAWQPLTGAMIGGSAPVTEMLLDRGADVEFKDEIGRSPLKVVLEEGVESERQEVVRLLLNKGASLEKAELNDEQKVLQGFLESLLQTVNLLCERLLFFLQLLLSLLHFLLQPPQVLFNYLELLLGRFQRMVRHQYLGHLIQAEPRFPRGVRLAIPNPLYFVVALLLGDDSIDVILLKVGHLAAATKIRPVVQDHTRVVLLEVELFSYGADPRGFGSVFEFDSEADSTCFFLDRVVFNFDFVCALPDEIILVAVLA
ncbi:hypothetical protein HG530_015079 [Fusarium avenaceum]|nr:hypothetical protein HG530_015079 [Fusarium avenaceum]